MTDSPDAGVREEARRRLKAKNDFKIFLAVAIVVILIVLVVWFVTSGPGSYFWPIWPIIGLSIGLLFSGLDAYGITRRYITESDIDAEVRRMQGGGPKA
jgi:fatty acid desaturase